MFFFFFSSRRRHTRFDCDWSSDVCSSDLRGRAREDEGHRRPLEVPRGEICRAAGGLTEMAITTAYRTRSDAVALRSFKTKGRPSAIAGMGVYAPEKVVTNFDLEKLMDTSDKWITERTGIHKRHIAEPGTTTFEIATKAARAALDAAGITAQ